jgi:hypothetical protein
MSMSNTDCNSEIVSIPQTGMVSLETLIRAIKTATCSMTVCVPSVGYYGDYDTEKWTEETICYIDPSLLLTELMSE